MGWTKKEINSHVFKQEPVMELLGIQELDLIEPSFEIKKRVRLGKIYKETDTLGEWQEVTLVLQTYKPPKQDKVLIVCISLKNISWADYTIEYSFCPPDCFMTEEYLMQVDHPNRLPDEVVERQQIAELEMMQSYIQNSLGNFRFE